MKNKVLLILVDGLRPDAIEKISHPFLKELKNKCAYTYSGKSVFPSVTLPCHMSIFHSVTPERHGVLDNVYTRNVHYIEGLFDLLNRNQKICSFYYTWEELRDLSRPSSLADSEYCSYFKYGKMADNLMCDKTIDTIKSDKSDFIFYYTGNTDEVAHKYGWMSKEYFDAIDLASYNIKRIFDIIPQNYSVIITADHGGHDRCHGTKMPEDMTIPMYFYGPQWQNKILEDVSLLDIAPTIANILGCKLNSDWEGKVIK